MDISRDRMIEMARVELAETGEKMLELSKNLSKDSGRLLSKEEKELLRIGMLNWVEAIQSEQKMFYLVGNKTDALMCSHNLMDLMEILV